MAISVLLAQSVFLLLISKRTWEHPKVGLLGVQEASWVQKLVHDRLINSWLCHVA